MLRRCPFELGWPRRRFRFRLSDGLVLIDLAEWFAQACVDLGSGCCVGAASLNTQNLLLILWCASLLLGS